MNLLEASTNFSGANNLRQSAISLVVVCLHPAFSASLSVILRTAPGGPLAQGDNELPLWAIPPRIRSRREQNKIANLRKHDESAQMYHTINIY